MGGFSSKSTPSAASESHGILKAIIYSVLFHQNLVAQGRAAPVVMPQLPKPDPKPKPAPPPPPPPQIVQIKVPVPPKPSVPAPAAGQPGAPAAAQPGAPAAAQPGVPAAARPGGTPVPAPATPATPGTAADPQAEAAKRRAEQRERDARGRSITLATSWRGVLTPLSLIGGRKTLLGE